MRRPGAAFLGAMGGLAASLLLPSNAVSTREAVVSVLIAFPAIGAAVGAVIGRLARRYG